MTCKFCGEPATDSELCTQCRQTLGLVEGSGVRAQLPCQRCNHPELVRALARELTTSPGEVGRREVRPMSVTAVPVAQFGFFSGRAKGVAFGVDEYRGILEMYVCTRCGFTEWYCRDPRNIPIGPEYGTETLTLAAQAPYR